MQDPARVVRNQTMAMTILHALVNLQTGTYSLVVFEPHGNEPVSHAKLFRCCDVALLLKVLAR